MRDRVTKEKENKGKRVGASKDLQHERAGGGANEREAARKKRTASNATL